MTDKLRVRFAPSPTGYLHIGGARTALFNWLFARHYGGSFILRIEDTDIERSTLSSEGTILSSLKWLGLDWDEGPEKGGDLGPYRQRERLEIYQKYAQGLIDAGKAYYCYCLEEELETRRKAALDQKILPGYDGRCQYLSAREIEGLVASGRKPTVRLKVPEGLAKIVVYDKLKGEVEFDTQMIRDFVILRSNGIASYNFAVVIDDHLMNISHVIRGDDHLSNTPRQILIYQSLGFDLPEFAHLPMILGQDGTRLSKRHGATSVEAYHQLGFLPEALVNYLALRGWSPPDEGKEILSQEELIEEFTLERVSKNAAIFDPEKLNWMGGMYIRAQELKRVTQLSLPYLKWVDQGTNWLWLEQVVDLVRPHLSCLSQITDYVDYLFEPEIKVDQEAAAILADSQSNEVLACLSQRLKEVEELTTDIASYVIKAVGNEKNLKGKELFMPIRAALTGHIHGPELPRIMALLGKDICLKRIHKAGVDDA